MSLYPALPSGKKEESANWPFCWNENNRSRAIQKKDEIHRYGIRRNTEQARRFHTFTARTVFSNSQLPGTREKTEVTYPASDTDTYFLGSGGSSSTLPIGMDSLFIYATGHDTNGFHLGRDTHGLSSWWQHRHTQPLFFTFLSWKVQIGKWN